MFFLRGFRYCRGLVDSSIYICSEFCYLRYPWMDVWIQEFEEVGEVGFDIFHLRF